MNQVKLKVYKEVFKKCINFDGAEDFINLKIKEISRENLSFNGGKALLLVFLTLKMVFETIVNM